MSEKSVQLIENFISWQGEGPDSGRGMIILRFKTCNRKCPWCDTSVKMRISHSSPHKLSDIQQSVDENNAGLLITGGEPTVEKHFDETVMLLNELTYPVANVESNGYNLQKLIANVQPFKPVKYMFSPKIFNNDDLSIAKNMTDEVACHNTVFIKIVYEPDNPFIADYMKYIVECYPELTYSHRVWAMPEGTTRSALIQNSGKVFDICEQYKFCFSSRSHIIYGFI